MHLFSVNPWLAQASHFIFNLPMDNKQNLWKKPLCWFYRKYSAKVTATTSFPSPRQVQIRNRPLPTELLPSYIRTNWSRWTTATAPAIPVIPPWRVKAKNWHRTQGCNGHFCPVSRNIPGQFFSYISVSWKQKFTWKVFWETSCNQI